MATLDQGIKPSMLNLGRMITDPLRPWDWYNTKLLLRSVEGGDRDGSMYRYACEVFAWVRHLKDVYLIVGYQTYLNANFQGIHKTASDQDFTTCPISDVQGPYWKELPGERVAAVCVRKVSIAVDANEV